MSEQTFDGNVSIRGDLSVHGRLAASMIVAKGEIEMENDPLSSHFEQEVHVPFLVVATEVTF